MRRTAEDAERTRLALLKAALMTFEEKGWRGATFEHVAERAGVTRGALHHHFRSKALLLEEALASGWAEYGKQLFPERASASERGSASEDESEFSLSGLLTHFVTLLRDDALFRALAVSSVLVAPQALGDDSQKQEGLDAWRDQIAATLPSTTDASADTVAGLVLVLLQGLTVSAVTRPDDLPQPGQVTVTLAALVRELHPE